MVNLELWRKILKMKNHSQEEQMGDGRLNGYATSESLRNRRLPCAFVDCSHTLPDIILK